MKKKTKINAHELEALRFFLTCYELTENTQLSAQGRGGRAEQGAGQGAAAGCVPAPTRPASINSWQFGGPTSAADMSIFCRFLTSAAALASLASCYRQVRLVCVCVRARKHVGTNFIPDQPTSTSLPPSFSLPLSRARALSLSLSRARSLSRQGL
jgi:hypothetical protein